MSKNKPTTPAEVLTIGDVIQRYQLLDYVRGLPTTELCAARSTNLMYLRVFWRKYMRDAQIPKKPEYEAFEKQAMEIRSKHLLTDENNKTLMQITNGQYEPIVNVGDVAFIEKFDALRATFKAAIDDREFDEKAYADLLKQPVPANELPPEKRTKLPKNIKLSQEQFDCIYWFLDEQE